MATYLTKAGVAKLEGELKEFRRQKHTLEEEVRKAREHGDLRENAEYHAAKERLQQVVGRISDLQYKLSHVEVVDPSEHRTDAATLGTRVTVKELSTGRQEQYTLVGPDESDPASGRISMLSPLGKAFLGHKVKERVTAQLPGGMIPFEIVSIEPAE